MRCHAEKEIARIDVDAAWRWASPLRSEWAQLRFADDGRLRNPLTGGFSSFVQLVDGRHREAGARYRITAPSGQADITLAFDDGRTVRGTASGTSWHADVELTRKVAVDGRVDVGAVLRANDVPGPAIALIGGGAGTGQLVLDPSALDRSGDLVHGTGRAQRCSGRLTVHVRVAHDVWRVRVTAHLAGRGVIGRLAMLAFRGTVHEAVDQALRETLDGAAQEAARLTAEWPDLEQQVRGAGGADAFVHELLWRQLSELSPAITQSPTKATDEVVSGMRLRRGPWGVRRWQRPVQLRFPAAAAERVTDRGSMMNRTELVVRAGRGRVRLHWPSSGRNDNPPVCYARVGHEPDGLTITGVIRESRAARGYSLIWGFAICLMAVVAAAGIYGTADGQDKTWLPLLIGLIAGPLFALFWRSERKSRRPNFVRQSGELEDGVQRWFASGDPRRHP